MSSIEADTSKRDDTAVDRSEHPYKWWKGSDSGHQKIERDYYIFLRMTAGSVCE